MLSVQRTFDVDRPVAEVFAYLSDFTNTEHWDPGTVTTTRTDDGPLGQGSRFHNVSEFRGRQTELEYELTTYEPTGHLVFTGNNKTVTSTDDLTLAANAGGTTITYRAFFDFHGVAKLAAPLLKRGFEKIADETVVQMRGTLEKI
jgi:uncharacterized protein YndB with AHSA1/START domain